MPAVPTSWSRAAASTVSATGSQPDGQTPTYRWDLDGNGTFETPGQSVTFSRGWPPCAVESDHRGPGDRLDRADRHRRNDGRRHLGVHDGFAGIKDLPAVNDVGPGKLTLTFSLGGNQGLDIFREGHPMSASYPCGTTPPSTASEPVFAPGREGLLLRRTEQRLLVRPEGRQSLVGHVSRARARAGRRQHPQRRVPLPVVASGADLRRAQGFGAVRR